MDDILKITLVLKDKVKNVEVKRGIKVIELAEEYKDYFSTRIISCKINNALKDLRTPINEECKVEFLDLADPDGMLIYRRTLTFIAFMAANRRFPNRRLSIMHSLGPGYYFEFVDTPIYPHELLLLQEEMKDIIKNNYEIERKVIPREEAFKIFEERGYFDKIKLFKYLPDKNIKIYKCEEYIDYLYGYLAPSTGYADLFDIKYYSPGFIITFPKESNPRSLPIYKEQRKIADIFREYEQWGRILNVGNVGELNEIIKNKDIRTFILVSEALHEKKIAQISDLIALYRDRIKLILIAGPSSSGKTTFSKRLSIELMVNGFRPIAISLDDYFVERNKTPLDENGNPDFESIHALDLDLINEHLTLLLEGKEVQLPKYDFVEGKRKKGKKLHIEEDQIIIMEGIHGLNDMLTSSVPHDRKFKIYVSALTQLNIDDHNRIPTTDVRKIRRMVRDSKFRGYGPLQTLKIWPSVRRGEEKWIFPFQEEADAMFNSALVYELSILKKYAEPLLRQIDSTHEEYAEAKRLLRFLSYFLPLDHKYVPHNSIIREFIGGSWFNY